MTSRWGRKSSRQAVAVAALLAAAVAALRGHIPRAAGDPFAGAVAGWVALVLAIAVLGVAMTVAGRPIVARLVARQFGSASSGADGADWHTAAEPRPATEPSMRSLVVVGGCLALLAEFVALWLPGQDWAAALTGVAVGLVLLGLRAHLVPVPDPVMSESGSDGVGDSLQRWVTRTESLIQWSESSRTDWDRYVRPIVARQFEMATKANQRRTSDPAAFKATGKMLFGEDLWQWVDPDNIVRGNKLRGNVLQGPAANRGPGRKRLEGILECLEQV